MIIEIYDNISEKLPEDMQADFYLERERVGCLYFETASKNAIINLDSIVKPLYNKYYKCVKRSRYVDFNQGVDARLITDKKKKKLSEINIRPLRIAFDHYNMKDTYVKSIKLTAKYGIKDLSNYLLYNYNDEPDELYYRMKLNIDLCEELGITIYSFPMKYHPIDDPEYFRNRDFIGTHWNRKFIRAIQAVLNSTKGKIGRGKSFFLEAFGSNISEFHKILLMPEPMIIYRMKYKNNLTQDWWGKFTELNITQQNEAKQIIYKNKFTTTNIKHEDKKISALLKYYLMERE